MCKERVKVKREERGIEIFEIEMKQIRPQVYIEKRSLIDQRGIELLLRTKPRLIERYRGGIDSKKSR